MERMIDSATNRFKFIFEIAKAGEMVMLRAVEDFVPILSSPEQRNQLAPDLLRADRAPIWCKSAPELELAVMPLGKGT